MLEVYTNNATVAADEVIPLSNVKVQKGPSSTVAGNTINLNRRGVYLVSADGTAVASAQGIVGFSIYKDGVEDPSAVTAVTAASGATAACGFTTMIQVDRDATPAPGSYPVQLQIINGGIDADWHINVTVYRLPC